MLITISLENHTRKNYYDNLTKLTEIFYPYAFINLINVRVLGTVFDKRKRYWTFGQYAKP